MAFLSEKLAEFRNGWRKHVAPESQARMDAHVAHLDASGIAHSAKQVGDVAPPIVLRDQHGEIVDVAMLVAKGPVVVTFYRGGWCPFCNLELKAYQDLLPRIKAAGAALVGISPEKPDDLVTTAEKNAVTFPILSDIGQAVGKAYGLVYAFTDEVKTVYDGFKLDIPDKNGAPDDWSLPLSATYLIGADGRILFADTRVDYRERTDPLEVVALLEQALVTP